MRIIYTLFLGLLIALFVVNGALTFYQRPASPTVSGKEAKDAYNRARNEYERNIVLMGVASSTLLLASGSVLLRNKLHVGEGVLAGGAMTMVYMLLVSLVNRFEPTTDKYFAFILASLGLAVALLVGFVNFRRLPQEK